MVKGKVDEVSAGPEDPDKRAGLFNGLGPFVGLASVLLVFGFLSFLLEIQSPSWVQIAGIKVQGVTVDGLTYYRYNGVRYSIDNRNASVNSPPTPTTVWLSRGDPSDTSKAYIDNAYDRWLDIGFVSLWFVLAAGVMATGFGLRAQRRRARRDAANRFGSGFSDDAVQRYLERQRGGVEHRRWSVDE